MPATTRKNKSSAPAKSAPAAKSIRRTLMLVDDHPMMRAGLAQLINQQADLQVVAEAGNPQEAFKLLETIKPDLILSDITMPGRSGIDFIRDVLALSPDLPILVVSMHDETIYAERVLQSGARGYIMKESGGENLLTAIRQVLSGSVYVSGEMSARIIENLSSKKPRSSNSAISRLSNREFEIFQLIGRGLGTRKIAEQLHISAKTIEVHRGHIKEKLGIKEAAELVHRAIQWIEAENAGKPLAE